MCSVITLDSTSVITLLPLPLNPNPSHNQLNLSYNPLTLRHARARVTVGGRRARARGWAVVAQPNSTVAVV